MIEESDAAAIEVGQKITLMDWGNVNISKKETEGGQIHLFGTVDEKDTDFKKTVKLHWLINDPEKITEINMVELDHLITKEKIEENDEVENIVNPDSRIEYPALTWKYIVSLPPKTHF